MPERHVPVLVVGGSLVGLTTSALLARHGVEHLLVESHAGTAIHPRAASFHQGTMEVFRSLGMQQQIEEAAAAEFVQNGAIIAVESLAGKELQYFYRSFNDGVEGLSPADRLFITQVGREPLIRQRAAELGAEHLFATELVSFEEREDHVAAVIRPRWGRTRAAGHRRLPGRRGRGAQQGADPAGHPQLGPRRLRRLRDDLLQVRRARPARRPQPQRGLRQPPRAARVLPVLVHR